MGGGRIVEGVGVGGDRQVCVWVWKEAVNWDVQLFLEVGYIYGDVDGTFKETGVEVKCRCITFTLSRSLLHFATFNLQRFLWHYISLRLSTLYLQKIWLRKERKVPV